MSQFIFFQRGHELIARLHKLWHRVLKLRSVHYRRQHSEWVVPCDHEEVLGQSNSDRVSFSC